MKRSLSVKLVMAFLLVSVTGVALTAIFVHWATFREFDRLVLEQVQEDFLADAADYYGVTGSWQGIVEYLPTPRMGMGLPPSQPGEPLRPPDVQHQPSQPPQHPAYIFALADLDGLVVLPSGHYHLNDRVSDEVLSSGIDVEVDGQVVGVALVTGEAPALSLQEERYLARTDRSSLYAALAATLVALALGVLLAQTLTRPVRELTAASHALAQGDLEQRVPVRSQDELGDLALSFNQMSSDLARAAELRRQMTADIAHDLRTPLTVMAGYLEALRDGVLQPSPERFETMHQEAQHLRRLVEDLRTLSMADAGEVTLNRESVPPEVVLEQAAAAYRHQAEKRGIELTVNAAPGLPNIFVDPDRMAQVLGNLVSNALHHTPVGGRILLASAREDQRVLLVVRDTGIGIPADKLSHVFDRFYRGDEDRREDSEGAGLGLAIAKSMVELHGGQISMESIPGERTTATITLPGSS